MEGVIVITQRDYDVVYGALTLACSELEKAHSENSEVNDYIKHGSLAGYFLDKAFNIIESKN